MVRLHRSGFRGRPDGCRVTLRSIPWSWIFRRSIFPRKLLTCLIPTSRIFRFAHLLTFSLLPYDQNGIRFARPGGFFFRSATRTKETYSTGRPSDIGPSLVQNGPIPKWRYRKNVSNKSASQNQIFGGDPLGARQVSASDTAVRNTVRRSSTKSG